MIEVKYPGKLFLMGEYAIMEPGQTAIIAAMNRFMYASINAHETIFVSSAFGEIQGLDTLSFEGPMRYVSAALASAHEYLGQSHRGYHLDLRSELEDASQKKYGLGSSGVVMVATIDAVLKFYGKSVSRLDLFKLTVIAQSKLDELSSGGDIAAAVFGGVVSYTRYEPEWVLNQSMNSLMTQDWPKLNITSLPQNSIVFDVAWTQNENKTTPYVRSFLNLKDTMSETYHKKLEEAQTISLSMHHAMTLKDKEGIKQSIASYRQWMLEIQALTKLNIETKTLTTIIDTAASYGFAAKISGSGGGDCAIIMNDQENVENHVKMHKALQKHGILLLDIEVYYDKSSLET